MIAGRVEKRHALLPVTFRLPKYPDVTIEFVVDTGFTDALCLPFAAVQALGLPYEFDFPATLADATSLYPLIKRRLSGKASSGTFTCWRRETVL